MQITPKAEELILSALKEDIPGEDITTNAVIEESARGTADLICKQTGVVCGLDVFARAFSLLDEDIKIEFFFSDGDKVSAGEKVAKITGNMRAILGGERTALNFLQRMSGVATYTSEIVKLLEGTGVKLLDTRKTTPNMRVFEKYAVKCGGGENHRDNLSDGVLLKDNHITGAGGVAAAVKKAKEYSSFVRKIEVEVETVDMCREAADAGADIIMLDNMSTADMKRCVELIAGRAVTECSGNVTKDRVAEIASTGVDYISCGALTHSAPILDFSLKNLVKI